jgi:hypothetical protein
MNAAPPAARRGLASPAATVWGYVRHELLFLCFALMEIALLTPVVLVGLGWARYWPAGQVTLWLLLVMLLPLNLVRLMALLQFDLRRQRRALMAALLLVILLSWRQLLYAPAGVFDLAWLRQFATNLAEVGNLIWARDLSIFVLTAFVWWRGIRLATRLPEINNVGLRLRLGGLIFAPLLVWFTSAFLETSIVPFLLLFFLAALTAVALVRAENIEEEQRGTAATLNARWFAVVFGAALLTVLAGGVLAVFLSGDSLFTLFGWFSPLWRALQFGGVVVLSVLFKLTSPALDLLAVIVQFLGEMLVALMSQIGEGFRTLVIGAETATPVPPTPTGMPEAGGPGLTGQTTAVLVMLGLIALVALALARAYRQATFAARDSQRSRVARDEEDEEPGLGRRLLERLGLLAQWRAAASIRRIYRLMCRAAAAAGYPRLEAETPYEYLPTLAQVWPEHAAEARLITEAFIRIRYGELPETSEELEQIRQAWRRLEEATPQRRAAPAEGPTLTKTKRE